MPTDVSLARFLDGPLAGLTLALPTATYPWPLPARMATLSHLGMVDNVALWDADNPKEAALPDEIAASPNAVIYRKINESRLSEMAARHPHIARGAEYRVISLEGIGEANA